MFRIHRNRRVELVLVAIFSLMLVGSKAYGADHYHLRKPVQHYLNIHIAGGEVSPFLRDVQAPPQTSQSPSIIGGVGAVSNFGLSYEIRYQKFFFNIGAEIDGDFQRFTLKAFTDTIHNSWVPSKEHDRKVNQANTYMYQHTDFQESDFELRWAAPIQFGYLFNSYFYGAVGVKYSMAITNYYEARSTIQTTMMLNNAISFNGEPIQVRADSKQATLYGIFPTDTYRFNSKILNNSYSLLSMISPTLELGARLPIAYRTVVRIGAFFEYGIPLGWQPSPERKHVVYDNIWALWGNEQYERKAEDLQLMGVNPIKNSDWTMKGFSTFSFGIRATFSFNVTVPKRWCNCETDTGIHPARSTGRSGGRVMR